MKVETVAVTVSLHSEAEANLFGLYWRPLYELKLGRCKVLRVLADYASAMFSLLFYFPAILCGWRRSSPVMAGLAQGPGFPNLSCLGLLSDRILRRHVAVKDVER